MTDELSDFERQLASLRPAKVGTDALVAAAYEAGRREALADRGEVLADRREVLAGRGVTRLLSIAAGLGLVATIGLSVHAVQLRGEVRALQREEPSAQPSAQPSAEPIAQPMKQSVVSESKVAPLPKPTGSPTESPSERTEPRPEFAALSSLELRRAVLRPGGVDLDRLPASPSPTSVDVLSARDVGMN